MQCKSSKNEILTDIRDNYLWTFFRPDQQIELVFWLAEDEIARWNWCLFGGAFKNMAHLACKRECWTTWLYLNQTLHTIVIVGILSLFAHLARKMKCWTTWIYLSQTLYPFVVVIWRKGIFYNNVEITERNIFIYNCVCVRLGSGQFVTDAWIARPMIRCKLNLMRER